MAPTPTQFQLVQAIPLIPVGLAYCASFFLHESPRWLAAQDREEDARMSLSYYRGAAVDSDNVRAEFEEIYSQLAKLRQGLRGVSTLTIIKEIVTVPSYRRRLIIALLFQTVAQWSGGNGITYYITDVCRVAPLILPSEPTLAELICARYSRMPASTARPRPWSLPEHMG